MTTLLIDADLLVYKAATATEFEMSVEVVGSEDEDLYVRVGSLSEAVAAAEKDINHLVNALKAKDFILCLTGQGNFRKELWPSYKANRTGAKPVTHGALRRELKRLHRHYERPGLEADDVMGILATNKNIVRGEKIIVSEDKDMLQIDCPIYRGGQIVSPADPDRWHLLQTLCGDQTDNYPGCPSVGIKTAEKLIPEDMPKQDRWKAVLMAYAKAGLSPEYALTQARVARILTTNLYDFSKKEPVLWNPE
jgi:DNA polymerase-1